MSFKIKLSTPVLTFFGILSHCQTFKHISCILKQETYKINHITKICEYKSHKSEGASEKAIQMKSIKQFLLNR